jgi:hypothetical protein
MSLLFLFPVQPNPLPPVVEIMADEDPTRVFLAWGNLIDQATLSGGSWASTLPLTNLQNRTLARVARSTNVVAASTWFDIDLGPDKTWRVIALQNHNMALDARYRIRASDDPAFAYSIHDSGWQDVWPAVFSEDELVWDDLNWWEGTYTEADRQGYTWTLIHKLVGPLSARYVRVEIQDPSNSSSYTQIGRVFIAPGYSPSRNMSVGASLAWEDDSEIQRAWGGAEGFVPFDRFRVARFTLANITDDEGYGKFFEMMRQAGITGEVLFEKNPSDTKNALRTTFVGRMRQLSPIEHPYPINVSAAFEIQESRR